ncbi:protein of unknown function [Pararobbsia alpina]
MRAAQYLLAKRGKHEHDDYNARHECGSNPLVDGGVRFLNVELNISDVHSFVDPCYRGVHLIHLFIERLYVCLSFIDTIVETTCARIQVCFFHVYHSAGCNESTDFATVEE